MSWDNIFRLCMTIAFTILFAYFFYKNNELDKKYADKPAKGK